MKWLLLIQNKATFADKLKVAFWAKDKRLADDYALLTRVRVVNSKSSTLTMALSSVTILMMPGVGRGDFYGEDIAKR
ncbi:hypothetical protein [Rosenbergiella metrosideri]|uniref:hypothetical protein n=1 Tax=Rosenbergiella metrosideri TaxID=2921185 RepID=UPI001F4FE199|nr:hypothetical protein [Rosenbergiella metrosideri]